MRDICKSLLCGYLIIFALFNETPSMRTRHPRKTDFCRDSRVRVKIYGSVSNEAPAGYRQKDAFAGCLRARSSGR